MIKKLVLDQTGIFNLGMTIKEGENSEFNFCKKTDLALHPARVEGLSKYIFQKWPLQSSGVNLIFTKI